MSDTSSSSYKIVVGFDWSDSARRALNWAVQEAAARGGTVEAINACIPGEYSSDQEQAEIAQKKLDDAVSETIGQASVHVEAVVELGHPSRVLLARSTGADMLVVGSRGRGEITSTVLGSVGRHAVTHPAAPVVVIVR